MTTCIEGIFEFSKVTGCNFFLGKKLFAKPLFTWMSKIWIILETTHP